MSREKTDFWVGLFILLGGAALVFLALQAGNLSSFSFARTYTLTADFDNIGGLKERAAVKSAGVVVGRVKSISFDDENFKAVVLINMEDQFLFPKDTSASILTSGLLGEQYIGLTAGGDEQNFANGEKIRYTQSAVVLENLISQFLYRTAESQGSQSDTNSTSAPSPAP